MRDRHAAWHGLRWTLAASVRCKSRGRNAESVRRNRVVLAPRPWRYVGGNHPAGNGGKKGRSPGRVRISRKAIARGKPGCLGCTCQSRVHSFYQFSTRCCGRSRRPAFPAPFRSKGPMRLQKPGQIMPRERPPSSGQGEVEIRCRQHHLRRPGEGRDPYAAAVLVCVIVAGFPSTTAGCGYGSRPSPGRHG